MTVIYCGIRDRRNAVLAADDLDPSQNRRVDKVFPVGPRFAVAVQGSGLTAEVLADSRFSTGSADGSWDSPSDVVDDLRSHVLELAPKYAQTEYAAKHKHVAARIVVLDAKDGSASLRYLCHPYADDAPPAIDESGFRRKAFSRLIGDTIKPLRQECELYLGDCLPVERIIRSNLKSDFGGNSLIGGLGRYAELRNGALHFVGGVKTT